MGQAKPSSRSRRLRLGDGRHWLNSRRWDFPSNLVSHHTSLNSAHFSHDYPSEPSLPRASAEMLGVAVVLSYLGNVKRPLQ